MRSFESEKLELKCIFESYPQPDIQWIRNDFIINNKNNDLNNFKMHSNMYKIIRHSESVCKMTTILEFPINSELIFANFSCIAINSEGNASKIFSIDGKS